MKKETGWSHSPPRMNITMKAPVTVRLTKLVTSQILDYFLGRKNIITMNIKLYLAYLIDTVTLVDGHGINAVGKQPVNGYLAFNIVRKPGYDNPLILHCRHLMRKFLQDCS